jgi:hypothetical protein
MPGIEQVGAAVLGDPGFEEGPSTPIVVPVFVAAVPTLALALTIRRRVEITVTRAGAP